MSLIKMCGYKSKKTAKPVGESFALCEECYQEHVPPAGLVIEVELDLLDNLECSECGRS